jgi:hypothetical protein
MGAKPHKPQRSIVGWLWLTAAAVAAMAGRRMTDSVDGFWRWVVWGLVALTVLKVLLLVRWESTSRWRLSGVLAAVAAAGTLGMIGIPQGWLSVPELAQLGSVFFPFVLLVVALLAVLVGIAHWNRHREMEGPSQYSRMAVVLNGVIAIVAWQVMRQPLWKDSLAGMMQLPQLYETRVALEEEVSQWTEAIRSGQAGAMSRSRPETGRVVAPRRVSVSGVGRGLAAITARYGDYNAPIDVRTRARFLQEMGCHADAAAELEPLVDSPDGDDRDIRECLRSLVLSNQIDHARELAERMIVRSPTRELHRWLACLYAGHGEVDRAISALRQLARRRPFNPVDAYILGELANLIGRPADALDAVAHLEGGGERTERTRLIAERARALLAMHPTPRTRGVLAQ